MEIKEYVRQELKRVAFLVKFADVLDVFKPRSKDLLESLTKEFPLTWESVRTEGAHKFDRRTTPATDYFKDAFLKGKLEGIDLDLQITTTNDLYKYTLEFLGKKHYSTSISGLKDIISSLISGATSKSELLLEAFKIFKTKKSELYMGIKTAGLYDLQGSWDFTIIKQDANIYLKIFAPVDSETKSKMNALFEADNRHRLESILSYVNTFLIENKFALKATINLIKQPAQAGFNIKIS